MVFGPFAAAIVAGLSVASLLTLFVVPSLYVVVENAKLRVLEIVRIPSAKSAAT